MDQKKRFQAEEKIWDPSWLERQIWDDVASCMDVLHSCALVHRDIREPNILFFGDHAQLIDYAFCTKPGFSEEEYEGTRAIELLQKPAAAHRWNVRTDYTLFKIVLQRLYQQ